LCLDFWRGTDRFGRGDATLLAALFVNTIFLICRRLYLYNLASRQTRAFAHDASAALRDGKIDTVIAIAAQNGRSHVATVAAAGLTAFSSALLQSTHAEADEAAQRALQRSQKMQSAELKVGLASFTTIASTATFIGLLGTCFGILYAFRGYAGEKHTWVIRVHSDISRSLVSLAIGLFVTVLAMWCRNYVRNRMQEFKTEMSNAAIETLMCIDAHRLSCNHAEHPAIKTMNSATVVTDCGPGEAPYDRQRVLLLAMWTYWIYLTLYTALRPIFPSL
jgi:biopolymer transport protein ExbB